MDSVTAIELARETLVTALTIAAPILAAVLCLALMLAILQTVTNLQEQTLTVVPKIILAVVVTYLLTPWVLSSIVDFTVPLFSDWLARR